MEQNDAHAPGEQDWLAGEDWPGAVDESDVIDEPVVPAAPRRRWRYAGLVAVGAFLVLSASGPVVAAGPEALAELPPAAGAPADGGGGTIIQVDGLLPGGPVPLLPGTEIALGDPAGTELYDGSFVPELDPAGTTLDLGGGDLGGGTGGGTVIALPPAATPAPRQPAPPSTPLPPTPPPTPTPAPSATPDLPTPSPSASPRPTTNPTATPTATATPTPTPDVIERAVVFYGDQRVEVEESETLEPTGGPERRRLTVAPFSPDRWPAPGEEVTIVALDEPVHLARVLESIPGEPTGALVVELVPPPTPSP